MKKNHDAPDPYLAGLQEAERACERVEQRYADISASTGAILCREEIKKMIEVWLSLKKAGAVVLALAAAFGCASKPTCVEGRRYPLVDPLYGKRVDAVCHNGHLQWLRTNEEPEMPPKQAQ